MFVTRISWNSLFQAILKYNFFRGSVDLNKAEVEFQRESSHPTEIIVWLKPTQVYNHALRDWEPNTQWVKMVDKLDINTDAGKQANKLAKNTPPVDDTRQLGFSMESAVKIREAEGDLTQCKGCREIYPKTEHACPSCGAPTPVEAKGSDRDLESLKGDIFMGKESVDKVITDLLGEIADYTSQKPQCTGCAETLKPEDSTCPNCGRDTERREPMKVESTNIESIIEELLAEESVNVQIFGKGSEILPKMKGGGVTYTNYKPGFDYSMFTFSDPAMADKALSVAKRMGLKAKKLGAQAGTVYSPISAVKSNYKV